MYGSIADDKFNATLLDTYRILATSPSSSPDPDRISNTILRKLAHVLALPVSILFQQSIAQNTFPSEWKKAPVVPIHKGNGPKGTTSSYRPICPFSSLGKSLERLEGEQILVTVSNYRQLSSKQHGFTKRRSTADAIDDDEPYDIITFDFSGAFDRVLHPLLLRELVKHGIKESEHR